LDVGIVIALAAATAAACAQWLSPEVSTSADTWFALAAFAFCLARPNAIVLVVGLYLLVATHTHSISRLAFTRSVAIFSALLIGWSWANDVRFGHFTPLSANGGLNLFIGNNAGASSYLARREFVPEEAAAPEEGAVEERNPRAFLESEDTYEVDRALAGLAWDYIVAHPRDDVRNTVLKVRRYWDWDLAPQHSLMDRLLYKVPYLTYAALAAVGIAVLWRQRRKDALLTLLTINGTYMLPHLVIFGVIRMRMTVEFTLLILAAVAVDAGLNAASRSKICTQLAAAGQGVRAR
jgi:hypothetical protein